MIDITSRIKTSRDQSGGENALGTVCDIIITLLHCQRVARTKADEEWVARNPALGQAKHAAVQNY